MEAPVFVLVAPEVSVGDLELMLVGPGMSVGDLEPSWPGGPSVAHSGDHLFLQEAGMGVQQLSAEPGGEATRDIPP